MEDVVEGEEVQLHGSAGVVEGGEVGVVGGAVVEGGREGSEDWGGGRGEWGGGGQGASEHGWDGRPW